METKKIDKKKLWMILLPVGLMILLVVLFFGLKKNKDFQESQNPAIILEPESKEEKKPENKLSAYELEKLQEQKEKRELENSSVRGSDFHRDIQSRNEYFRQRAEKMKKDVYQEQISNEDTGNEWDNDLETIDTPRQSGGFRKKIEKQMEKESEEQTINNILHTAARQGKIEAFIAENEQLKQEIAKKYNLPVYSEDELLSAVDPDKQKDPIHKPDIEELTEVRPKEISEPQNDSSAGGQVFIVDGGKRKRRTDEQQLQKTNLIKACIHGDQTVVSGGIVRMRLLESLKLNQVDIPANTIFYGTVGIGSNRLSIVVKNFIYGDYISPVSFTVYDNDAMVGLNLPDNMKAEAVKQLQRGMTQGIHLPISSIGTVTSEVASAVNATTQVTKQLLNKNLSQLKVDLKANYNIYIYEETKAQKTQREADEAELFKSLQTEPVEVSPLERLLY